MNSDGKAERREWSAALGALPSPAATLLHAQRHFFPRRSISSQGKRSESGAARFGCGRQGRQRSIRGAPLADISTFPASFCAALP